MRPATFPPIVMSKYTTGFDFCTYVAIAAHTGGLDAVIAFAASAARGLRVVVRASGNCGPARLGQDSLKHRPACADGARREQRERAPPRSWVSRAHLSFARLGSRGVQNVVYCASRRAQDGARAAGFRRFTARRSLRPHTGVPRRGRARRSCAQAAGKIPDPHRPGARPALSCPARCQLCAAGLDGLEQVY
mmetsp:Transcript_4487/g.14331  ORF Transcript_4487/g.14331 Transcript_4487/m.14331 type:complete len:191 (-) Transcript_4487:705-1277(-)